MLRPLACLPWILCLSPVLAAENVVPLFNGTNLDGWISRQLRSWNLDRKRRNDPLHRCSIGELRTTRMYQTSSLSSNGGTSSPRVIPGYSSGRTPRQRGQPFIRGLEVQVPDGQEGDCSRRTAMTFSPFMEPG